jgi:hypothetical protein
MSEMPVAQEVDALVIGADNSEEAIAATEEALALAQEKLAELEQMKDNVMSSIAEMVVRKLERRMANRKTKECQWLEAMKNYLGPMASRNYTTTAQEFYGGSKQDGYRRPEHNITKPKCQIAIGQSVAYQFAAGDKNWSIRPPANVTPSDIDPKDQQELQQQMAPPPAQPGQGPPQQPPPMPSLQQVASYKASKMEKAIETHLANACYGVESRKAMWNRVVLGVGILKGPNSAGKMKKVYQKAPTSDGQVVRIPTYINERVPECWSVNPWYFFPDDTVADFCDAEDAIEIHIKNKSDVRNLLKHDGFFKEQLIKVLEEDPITIQGNPFDDPAWLTEGLACSKGKYIMAEYHGPLSVDELEFLGIKTTMPAVADQVYCEAFVINNHVVRLKISTSDGGYCLPYFVCPWEPDPASCFGFGIPMEVADQQRSVNEIYKMLLDNGGLTALPMMIVDTTLIKPVDGGMEIQPGKVFYSEDAYGNDLSKAIQFVNVPNNFDGINALLGLTKAMADEQASIPAIMSGMNLPSGAADSATGMAIINQNAQSPIFFKSEEWDDRITGPFIKAMYEWEMENNPDDSIKGTYDVDVRTTTAYLRNTLNQQKLERLSMEIGQGSPIGEVIVLDEMVRARLSGMDLPNASMIKDPMEVQRERANKPPPPPDPNLIKAQADMMKVENDRERLELEKARLQFDQQQSMQKAQMEYETQARNDQVRMAEARARTIEAEFKFRTAELELAAKDELARTKIMADVGKTNIVADNAKFLKGMEIPLKIRDQNLKEQEMKLKRDTGTGV